MNVFLEPGARMPQRAHDEDVGYDLFSTQTMLVPAHGSAVFHTGVHVELPRNRAGMVMSKSGLHIVHDITTDGLVDPGYDGEIMVKLTNHGDSDYWVERGDKIAQLVVATVTTEPLVLVDSIEGGERGSNGFGSTGR